MFVSVIIPTYNGAHKLPSVLQAIARQSKKPDEIIVVIDGSTDDTRQVLEAEKTNIPNLRWIYQENRGRAVVRNTGAHAAKGDLLVFFDDDMLPSVDCLAVHIDHHTTYSNSILTGAQIDYLDDRRTDIQKFKAFLSKKWSEPLRQMEGKPLCREQVFITAANFSIPKDLFLQLGGFDDQLTDAEDFDLAIKAYRAKIALYYNHKAFAWHNDLVTGIGYIKRLRQYNKAHQFLKEFKPDMYKDVPQFNQLIQPGKKQLAFLFFANRFWVRWLDKNGIKMILPKDLRYKMYDWIITANGVYFPEKVAL